MPLPEFDYISPKTLNEALDALAKYGADAKVMAGGTDLIVLMRERIVKPKCVIDVKGVKEMQGISWDAGDGLKIGAAVPANEILDSKVVKEKFGVLWNSVKKLADPTIRNRATLGGNICNASPAADTAPALLVLEAEVEVVGKNGTRKIPIKDFFKGVKRTALAQGEIVKSIRIPNPPAGSRGDYMKWGRTKGEDLCVVGVAALVYDSGKKLRIALSSVAPTPLLVPDAEQAFESGRGAEEKIENAVSAVKPKICPISDVRCMASYRAHMMEVLTRRLLKQLLGVS